MQAFWNKWAGYLDEEDVYRYILRDFDEHERRGRSNRRDGDNYHHDKEEKLRMLARIYEKIEDYFESQGLDPRQYMDERSRRGVPGSGMPNR